MAASPRSQKTVSGLIAADVSSDLGDYARTLDSRSPFRVSRSTAFRAEALTSISISLSCIDSKAVVSRSNCGSWSMPLISFELHDMALLKKRFSFELLSEGFVIQHFVKML